MAEESKSPTDDGIRPGCVAGLEASIAEQLPTKKEMRQLPRWAQVAFAVRCARRVLPLVKRYSSCYGDKESEQRQIRAVEHAIAVAEQPVHRSREYSLANFLASNDYTDTAHRASASFKHGGPIGDPCASFAAKSAMDAAYAAYLAASDDRDHLCGATWAAADRAITAGTLGANKAASSMTASMIAWDFLILLEKAQQEKWTDDTAVPPESFSPLWPDGPPPGWPT